MKMWKKAASIALVSALTVSMAACGNGGGSDKGSADADTFKIGGIGQIQQEMRRFMVRQYKTVSSLRLTRSMKLAVSTDIRSNLNLRMTSLIPKSRLMRTIR